MHRWTAPLLAATLLTGWLTGCGADAGSSGEPATSRSPGSSSSPRDTPSAAASAGVPPASDAAPTVSARPRVIGTVADGLRVPWGIDFLPDGSALVTERDTTKVLHLQDGAVRELGTIADARPQGEAGLLGIAVSPSFATDARVFLYATTGEDNRVLRTTLRDGRLGEWEPILTGIPNASIHDGGRLEFGPDGFLYVSTGEAGDPPLAQDPDSLGGKILRITADGEPAPGNPRPDSPVWSTGHRNVQGLAFDERDRLWASEFGQNTWDELNLIQRDANYGWPEAEGRDGSEDFVAPQAQWRTEDASPSGLAYARGHVWMAALRGERLWRVPVSGEAAGEPRGFLVGEYGRMRSVVSAPDGNLWVTTSNHDGRGDPTPADDRILLVRP